MTENNYLGMLPRWLLSGQTSLETFDITTMVLLLNFKIVYRVWNGEAFSLAVYFVSRQLCSRKCNDTVAHNNCIGDLVT